MDIDWGFAGQIGGIGFGMVFTVLLILAIILWLVGMVFRKLETGKDETGDTEKGA